MPIYEPSGRAREYAARALNHYRGCDHLCDYCYAPRFVKGWTHRPTPALLMEDVERTCHKHAGSRETCLLCFTSDPYNHRDAEIGFTRNVLMAMFNARVPVSILTKGGRRCLRDLDLFQRFGRSIIVGATLTGCDDLEPGAAPNAERLEVLRELHAAGVPTWASFEPVIRTEASLALLSEAVTVCDLVKVGKVNQWGTADRDIDWRAFLDAAKAICDSHASISRMYVKTDLWRAAGCPSLPATYRTADDFQALPFDAAVAERNQASLL
jgi:DNA repair photolyase